MPKFDGFSAWITIGKRKVEEFNERLELEERSTICYVTSDTGKQFTVHWRVPSGEASYLINLFVDGRFVDDCVSYGDVGRRSDVFGGMWIDEETKSPFVFSDPTFKSRDEGDGDDSNGSIGYALAEEIGTIYVEMVEVRVCDDSESDDDVDRMGPDRALKTRRVPEEKSSMLTHTVGSVREESFRVKCPEDCYFKYFAEPKPVTCFVFRYRSEAFLQASGIIPNLEQSDLRRSQRKRKSLPLDNDAAEPSEHASKRERTTFSEDEVELKLTVLDPEAAEATGSAAGIQIEDNLGVDQIEIPNSVRSLTDAEIRERRDTIAREQTAINEEHRRLEMEDRLLDAQQRRIQSSLADDHKPQMDTSTIRKQAKKPIEIIDLTGD